jgi:peptidyl-prolyl cis-trans isomerase SurA
MKTGLILQVLFVCILSINCQAQNLDNKVLMTVAGREVEAGEFIRMYNKSPEQGGNTDLDEFIRQFIEFKLKVAEALAEGYDTTKEFINELSGYRKQLAQSYLTDNDIKDKMLQEAYRRSLTEIKASHILIACPPGASPPDTLRAYNKALSLRQRILDGEAFEEVALKESDDKSIRLNHGNLGYFTVFQMIKPFEDAAYTLEPGTISFPVRSSFGYHIIQVTGKRPSRGKIRVAHIMKSAPAGSSDSINRIARQKIDSLYQLLRDGASFSKLAAEYSDDRISAARGGELSPFGTGEIIPDFSEAAFSLKDTGDFSLPVQTIYGYHLIQLLDKYPPLTFEQAKPYLESKIKPSDLISSGKKSFVTQLKKEYNFKTNPKAYEWFVSNSDTLIICGKEKFDRESLPAGNIYTFADQELTCNEFAGYLESKAGSDATGDPVFFVKQGIESSISDQILRYEDSILEEKYPEFRYLMDEFHDGILLYDLSSDKIWNIGPEDSTSLKKFYESNKNRYLSGKSIEAKKYSLMETDGKKELEKYVKKYGSRPGGDRILYEKFNRNNDSLLVISEGTWNKGDDPDMDLISWTTGIHKIARNGIRSVITVYKVNEPVVLPLEEVKAEVMSDYQDWLNSEWIKQLTKKYTVKIDNPVLKEVRKKLNNE